MRFPAPDFQRRGWRTDRRSRNGAGSVDCDRPGTQDEALERALADACPPRELLAASTADAVFNNVMTQLETRRLRFRPMLLIPTGLALLLAALLLPFRARHSAHDTRIALLPHHAAEKESASPTGISVRSRPVPIGDRAAPAAEKAPQPEVMKAITGRRVSRDARMPSPASTTAIPGPFHLPGWKSHPKRNAVKVDLPSMEQPSDAREHDLQTIILPPPVHDGARQTRARNSRHPQHPSASTARQGLIPGRRPTEPGPSGEVPEPPGSIIAEAQHPQILALVMKPAPALDLQVRLAPPDTVGYARASAVRPDGQGGVLFTQCTVSSDRAAPAVSMAALPHEEENQP